jgi:hypothetical protein
VLPGDGTLLVAIESNLTHTNPTKAHATQVGQVGNSCESERTLHSELQPKRTVSSIRSTLGYLGFSETARPQLRGPSSCTRRKDEQFELNLLKSSRTDASSSSYHFVRELALIAEH